MRPLIFLLTAAVGGSVSCMRPHEPVHDTTTLEAPAAVPATVDVPKLLPLNIDQLRERVGPLLPVPHSFVDPMATPALVRHATLDSTCLFRQQGLAVIVAYSYDTRQVTDLLLLGTDENELMRRGKLKLGALDYLVLPVFEAERPTQLLGLRVLATGQKSE